MRGATLNAVTIERRRIGQRLPVAGAELQLDRAVAQAKAELLVVVDAAFSPASREKLRATASEAASVRRDAA